MNPEIGEEPISVLEKVGVSTFYQSRNYAPIFRRCEILRYVPEKDVFKFKPRLLRPIHNDSSLHAMFFGWYVPVVVQSTKCT